ncbi:phosphoribosyl-ATP pyrophosphohydrolase [Roseibium litorale]|uniref:Phosphoribosyl-ATP pyrophosphohydrolase n=1 Tax=Roseibium litorale TaxID=2803841 RepID=A0ABR9CJ38_9HYPH|nr:phosphoribosyl-ATP pyrophosphohydrolase [Roseibium litorale]MBD8890321.1 phosphoribosyl-ATP pyrophosphohydrolase [Roseibium litorale]
MTSDNLSDLSRQICEVSDIYADRFGISRSPSWFLAKLTEELGELVAADLKCEGNGRTAEQSAEGLVNSRAEEAADLFAHLLLFCRDRGIDLETALARKWFKYLGQDTERIPGTETESQSRQR